MFSKTPIFLLLVLLTSNLFSCVLSAPKSKPKATMIADPNEELKESGLKCLLDILHKIDNDKSDGTYKGDLKDDGSHTDTMKLNQLFKVGVDQGIDLTTLLLQYYNLESKPITISDGGQSFKLNMRKAILDCKLNLTKAIKRCNWAYKKLKGAQCERVRWGGATDLDLAPFVTLKCPGGYKRYGCCKCLRDCNKHFGLVKENPKESWTGFDYCMKQSQVYSENTEDTKAITNMDEWEIYDGKYVRRCSSGFVRVGDYKCLAKCPLGWPDLGDRCLKKGSLMVFPFVWQVGDGSSTDSSKPDL